MSILFNYSFYILQLHFFSSAVGSVNLHAVNGLVGPHLYIIGPAFGKTGDLPGNSAPAGDGHFFNTFSEAGVRGQHHLIS